MPLSVVPELELFGDSVGVFESSVPALTVQQFDLHAGPERLGHGVEVPTYSSTHLSGDVGFGFV